MFNELKKAISEYEPRMILLSADANHTVTMQLLDCDEFNSGQVTFEKIRVFCVGMFEERYESLEAYNSHSIPQDFTFISPESLDKDILIVLNVLSDYEDVSCLPVLGKRRAGYVICESVVFKKP
jgi:hypothetical protein